MSETTYDPQSRAWFEHVARQQQNIPLDADNFVDGSPLYKSRRTEWLWRWFSLGFECCKNPGVKADEI